MMERDLEESPNGLLASPASTSPLGSSSISNVSSSPRSPVPSYMPSTSPSSFPVSPSAKTPLSVLLNGSEERGGRRGGVIVGRRGGPQRLSASEDLQERRREEEDVDSSLLSPRSAIRRQNALHHSYGADTIPPTTSHATFAVDVVDSEVSTRARTASEEDAAPRRRAWASSTKRYADRSEPVTGDALTQKRSLISPAKSNGKPRDRLSAEFESENSKGRTRKASFAEHRLSHNRSEDVLAEVVSAPVAAIAALSESFIRLEEVYLEGWLTKINTDQRRWFVLTNETFAYYKNENTSGVDPRTRIHRDELKRVSRSMAGMEREAGNNTTRRAHNALLRMVKTPRTRKKTPSSPSAPDGFGSAMSPSRNTKSQQSPTTGSEKNLQIWAPHFFIITSNAQERAFALGADDCVETAAWMLAIGGLSHYNLNNQADSPLDENERRELLRYLHFEGYKGGILKTSREEEWHYWPKGLIKSDRGVDPAISYTWDGECFNPVLKGDEQNFGRGKWNGVWIEWYPPNSSTAAVRYQWHPVAREYRTEKEADNWKWTRHFLASTSGRGEWIMEGEIPEIVVMMLQLLVYARERPEMRGAAATAEATAEETTKKEEDIIKSRLKDFEVMGVTDLEIERLLKLRKLSEHRKRPSASDGITPSTTTSDETQSTSMLVHSTSAVPTPLGDHDATMPSNSL